MPSCLMAAKLLVLWNTRHALYTILTDRVGAEEQSLGLPSTTYIPDRYPVVTEHRTYGIYLNIRYTYILNCLLDPERSVRSKTVCVQWCNLCTCLCFNQWGEDCAVSVSMQLVRIDVCWACVYHRSRGVVYADSRIERSYTTCTVCSWRVDQRYLLDLVLGCRGGDECVPCHDVLYASGAYIRMWGHHGSKQPIHPLLLSFHSTALRDRASIKHCIRARILFLKAAAESELYVFYSWHGSVCDSSI